MRKFRTNYVVSWVFLFVIIGFMFSICAAASRKSIIKLQEESTDWEKLYPFEADSRVQQQRKKTLPEKVYAYIKEKCKKYTSDYLKGYYSLVESAKRYENMIGWNMASVFDYNAVVKLPDNYLTVYGMSKDVTADAKSTIELAEFCRQRGIDFFYVNAPVKVCISDDKDISGVLDFRNTNADRFLEILAESGVKYYDLREYLHKDGMNHHKAFFITDNHWKIETGLWAAGRILKFLRDDYNWSVNLELLNPEKFSHDVYPEWFLGGKGKKSTLARTQPEDFTFIYPKYETSIKLYKPDRINYTSGDFFLMCNTEELQKDFYGKNTYGAYKMQGALFSLENNMIHNGRKILMIRDSFAASMFPFLLLGIQNIDAIDLRFFTGSLKSCIKAINPDVVIVMYYSAMPGQDKRMYDFR